MAGKITVWTPTQAKKELSKRLQHSTDHRRYTEYSWETNERSIYYARGPYKSPRGASSSDSNYTFGNTDVDNSDSDVAVGYAFKNLRFLHAQMSANPPAVVVRPTSNDQDDRRKADAADRLSRYAIRQYKMQEWVDKTTLNTLLYGTGFLKITWDEDCGDILEMDEESGELLMEGDIKLTAPSPWDLYIDPDAETWEEARYLFERVVMPMEEAKYKWPEYSEVLQKASLKDSGNYSVLGNYSQLSDQKYEAVQVYQYWERGLPQNGYVGRFCWMTADGTVLGEVGPNPFRFTSAGSVSRIQEDDRLTDEQKEMKIKRLPRRAQFPYHILTDIDVPDKIWGKSFIDYISGLQELLTRLDTSTLDNVQAHSVARLVIPEGAEVMDDSITNSPWDIVKITGNQGPWFTSPPSPMPESSQLRDRLKQGIDDVSGVNESMFGQQSREQSGFSMQYATNQGNMIRRRVFNKYAMFVEDVYRSYFNLIRQHWDVPRTIHVLGKEKAFLAVDLQGADIDGGWDITVEYGTSLSLDPMTRRQEVMSMQPMFEKAGVPARVSLQMLKLNELEGMYDLIQLADDRQREYFEEIIATESYLPPEPMEDHQNMIAYALRYFMTVEFKYLDPEMKELLRQHIRERSQLAASEAQGLQGGVGAGPQPPGPPPQGPAGPLPEDAGMSGEQAGPQVGTEIVNQ